MERAARVASTQEPFKGADELSSETSTQEGFWTEAKGVIVSDGSATRMNGKSVFNNLGVAVMNFSQLSDFIIVQTSGSVISVPNDSFFVTTGNLITDEDGSYILTEDGERLTT